MVKSGSGSACAGSGRHRSTRTSCAAVYRDLSHVYTGADTTQVRCRSSYSRGLAAAILVADVNADTAAANFLSAVLSIRERADALSTHNQRRTLGMASSRLHAAAAAGPTVAAKTDGAL